MDISRALGTGAALAVLMSVMSVRCSAREATQGIDFLDENLPIPESALFNPAAYTQSGVGLSFGVDKRLSYETGNYAEAVSRFEQAVAAYRYKAEIWVYLARAYFYMKSPQHARSTLKRAAEVMPDLKKRFWDPLLASMLDEIRRRADRMRIRAEYYSTGPEDYLSVFRMYTFLRDYPDARAMVLDALENGRKLRSMAESLSPDEQPRCLEQAVGWFNLATDLRTELKDLGADISGLSTVDSAAVDSGHEVRTSALRELQLRVDFYEAAPEEYRRLFELYGERGDSVRQAAVLVALQHEIARTQLEVDTASRGGDLGPLMERKSKLAELLEQLRERQGVGRHAAP